MSDIDRTELRRLLDAATPGPWWHEWVDGDDWWAVYGQPTGDMVCPEVCTMGSPDEAAYIAAVNPAVVLGLLDEIERLTGEPNEEEIDRAGDVLAAHEFRVTDWYPCCTCGWRAAQTLDVASFDRHVARVALRAARWLS